MSTITEDKLKFTNLSQVKQKEAMDRASDDGHDPYSLLKYEPHRLLDYVSEGIERERLEVLQQAKEREPQQSLL